MIIKSDITGKIHWWTFSIQAWLLIILRSGKNTFPYIVKVFKRNISKGLPWITLPVIFKYSLSPDNKSNKLTWSLAMKCVATPANWTSRPFNRWPEQTKALLLSCDQCKRAFLLCAHTYPWEPRTCPDSTGVVAGSGTRPHRGRGRWRSLAWQTLYVLWPPWTGYGLIAPPPARDMYK